MKPNSLKASICEAGMRYQDFCAATGIPYITFYKRMEGRADFKLHEIVAICKVLRLTKDRVFDIFFDELVSETIPDKERSATNDPHQDRDPHRL